MADHVRLERDNGTITGAKLPHKDTVRQGDLVRVSGTASSRGWSARAIRLQQTDDGQVLVVVTRRADRAGVRIVPLCRVTHRRVTRD